MNASLPDVERLPSREALVGASGGHPVIRLDTGPGLHLPALGLPGSTAVAWCQTWPDGRRGVQFLGTAADIAALVAEPGFSPWFEAANPVHVSAGRAVYDVLDVALPVSGGNTWDWLWTTDAPPVTPAEQRVQWLDPAQGDALNTFLQDHNPQTHAIPFARAGQRWVVIRDREGAIIGSGCTEPGNAVVPLLGGITTHPAHRGQGLGGAITAYLTREALGRTGAATLAVFEDNASARRLYEQLGYRIGWAARTRFVTDGT